MRIKSGWWESGGGGGGYSAGKIKSTALVDTLAAKTRDWAARHGKSGTDKFEEKLEGPGFFVFKHREHQVGKDPKLSA